MQERILATNPQGNFFPPEKESLTFSFWIKGYLLVICSTYSSWPCLASSSRHPQSLPNRVCGPMIHTKALGPFFFFWIWLTYSQKLLNDTTVRRAGRGYKEHLGGYRHWWPQPEFNISDINVSLSLRHLGQDIERSSFERFQMEMTTSSNLVYLSAWKHSKCCVVSGWKLFFNYHLRILK